MKNWSNLAKVVFKRTYAREIESKQRTETWEETIERVVKGNVRLTNVSDKEVERLLFFMSKRKAIPAGRGLWYSGTESHEKLGGVALNNCWAISADDWTNFVLAQDLLMLGGGVGCSVEHRFVSRLPKIKKEVNVVHLNTKDADFIVPDSRSGWCDLTYRILESFFVTGKSFSFSTVCLRGYGEKIKGFGGTSSGPMPLVQFIEKISTILQSRQGRHLRPIDAADIMCCIGEMVVMGNVRRSAIIILGDAFDKEYLQAKRWDLGPLPTQRAMANWSVICDDIEDLHPYFWKTYQTGEPFGIVNRKNIQKYGRMGELRKDSAYLVNPCVAGETEILTDKGYSRIDGLVDQFVNIWNGFEFSKVTPRITGIDQKMLKITLSSGQELRCTRYHEFAIQRGNHKDFLKTKAIDLKVGMKLIKHDYPVIEHGDLFDKAYSQGFYSGDGSSDGKVFYLYGAKIVCKKGLSGRVGNYNELDDKTMFTLDFEPFDKNYVPFNWNLKSKLEWIAGLLDSDGCELKEGGSQTVSVNKTFLLDVQKLLSTIGIGSKVVFGDEEGLKLLPDHKGGYKEYKCQETWRLCIGAMQMQFLKRLGLECYRLIFDKNPQRDASRFVTINSIVEDGVEEKVYCFNEPKRHLGCFNGIITGNCGEATLENAEPCNLQEINLAAIENEKEFIEAARLMHRYGKRVTLEKYHHSICDEVVKRNRRVGTGITGCLQSELFIPNVLDNVYDAIQDENIKYSKELGIPQSIRTTVIKPSGSVSKMLDAKGEGIHPGYSRHFIQRIRFSAIDPLIPILKESGHYMEPVVKFDGTLDHNTLVVDFYEKSPDNLPVADENWDTFKQLDAVKMAQKHWADQSISVTVYYKKEEVSKVKEWLADNLKYLKTISFLCHNDHGFKQAPKETITKEQYEKLQEKVKSVNIDEISNGDMLEGTECEGGVCPIK